MDMHVLTNEPLEFTVGGRKLRAATLSVGEIYSSVEAEIKQQYIDDMARIQAKLEPRDRAEFARLALQSMPQGRELEAKVSDRLMTVGGNARLVHLALSKHQKITLDEVIQLSEDHSDGTAALAAHVLGLQPGDMMKGDAKADPGQPA